jgi:hypothetical protein
MGEPSENLRKLRENINTDVSDISREDRRRPEISEGYFLLRVSLSGLLNLRVLITCC